MEIKKIEQLCPIRSVAERYGVQFRRNRCACPIHKGKDFNAMCEDDAEVFSCFVCGKSWGSVNFVRAMENCDVKTAIAKLDQMFNLGLNVNLSVEERRRQNEKHQAWLREEEKRREARQAEIAKQVPIEREKAKNYIKSLVNRKDAWGYLRGRGICSRLCDKYGVRGCRIKVFDGKEDKVGHFENAIMIPYSRNDDEVWCWRRSMTSKEFRKTKAEFMGESEPVFNYPAVKRAIDQQKRLFVCESPIDALSAEQIFGDKQVEYISIGGSFSNRFWKWLDTLGKPIKIVGGFDNDNSNEQGIRVGERISEDFARECEKREIPYQRFEFDADCKDINDLLQKKLKIGRYKEMS